MLLSSVRDLQKCRNRRSPDASMNWNLLSLAATTCGLDLQRRLEGNKFPHDSSCPGSRKGCLQEEAQGNAGGARYMRYKNPHIAWSPLRGLGKFGFLLQSFSRQVLKLEGRLWLQMSSPTAAGSTCLKAASTYCMGSEAGLSQCFGERQGHRSSYRRHCKICPNLLPQQAQHCNPISSEE